MKEEIENFFVYFINKEGEILGMPMKLTASEVQKFVQNMEMYEETQDDGFHWGFKKYED